MENIDKFSLYAYSALFGIMMFVSLLMIWTLVMTAGMSNMLSVVCVVGVIFLISLMHKTYKNIKDIRISQKQTASFKHE